MTTTIACVQNYTTDTLLGKQDCYQYHVRTFVRWLEDNERTFELEAVADYFRALNDSQYSAGTIRMKRQAVKNRLVTLADSRGLNADEAYRLERALKALDRDPETKAPQLATTRIGGSKTLSDAEYDTVLKKARSRRQTLFMRFLWDTGCRVSELTGALLRNCKREGKIVYIRIMGKGRKERQVMVSASLYDAIRSEFRGEVYLFETAGGKQYQRSYVSNQIGKITKHAIGRRMSAHKLRHSFASRIYDRFPSQLSSLSEYLGHASVSTTVNMYVHSELTASQLLGPEVLS